MQMAMLAQTCLNTPFLMHLQRVLHRNVIHLALYRAIKEFKSVLKPGGILVVSGVDVSPLINNTFFGNWDRLLN